MVEHQSRKLGVVGSNPTGGTESFDSADRTWRKKNSQLAGFEPTRAEPIGFQVQRLNHSATTASFNYSFEHQAKGVDVWGIETWAFYMQSVHFTTLTKYPVLVMETSF